MAKKKCSGPNIAGHALSFRGKNGRALAHVECGDERILQPVKNYIGTPTGRPFCKKCQRLVGKKAWRRIEEQMDRRRPQPPEGYVVSETVSRSKERGLGKNSSGLYRVFTRRKELQLMLDITSKEAAKLQKILDRVAPERLREMIQQEHPELAATFEIVMKKAAKFPPSWPDAPQQIEPQEYAMDYADSAPPPMYPEPIPFPADQLPDPGPQVNTSANPNKWVMQVGGCWVEIPKGLFEVEDLYKFENGARGLASKFHVNHLRDLMQALADEITDECGTSPVAVSWRKQGQLVMEELPEPEPEYNEDADEIPF